MKNTEKMSKVVLDTEIVKINDIGTEYQVLVRMSRGGVIEHEPFPKTIQGLVSAMQLATEICAGKFFPRQVVETSTPGLKIEAQRLIG